MSSIFDQHEVCIVRLDGWEGIYVDGQLQEQGPNISRRWPRPFAHPSVPKWEIDDAVAGHYHFLPDLFTQIPTHHLWREEKQSA